MSVANNNTTYNALDTGVVYDINEILESHIKYNTNVPSIAVNIPSASNNRVAKVTNLKEVKGYTPLQRAIINGNRNEITSLISLNSTNINYISKKGITALGLAIIYDTTLIDPLIKRGADINVKDNDGNNILMLQIIAKNFNYVKKIAEYYESIGKAFDSEQNNDGDTPLLLALKHRDFAMFSYLCKIGADVNHIKTRGENSGRSVLAITLKDGLIDYALTLIKHHAIIGPDTTSIVPIKREIIVSHGDDVALREAFSKKGNIIFIASGRDYIVMSLKSIKKALNDKTEIDYGCNDMNQKNAYFNLADDILVPVDKMLVALYRESANDGRAKVLKLSHRDITVSGSNSLNRNLPGCKNISGFNIYDLEEIQFIGEGESRNKAEESRNKDRVTLGAGRVYSLTKRKT